MRTVVYILWIIYASLEGIREGYYFHYKTKVATRINEHIMFTIQRVIVWIPFSFLLLLGLERKIEYLNPIFLIFLFMLPHNGFYYLTRDKLDNSYPNGFFSNSSDSSTSWMDKKGLTSSNIRLALFIIGVFGIIIVNI